MKLFIGVALLICLASLSYCTDYCNMEGCKGNPHIGCNADNKPKSTCGSNSSIEEFNEEEIKLILHLHNDLRNAISNGSIPGYEPCAQMAKMTYDKELAYLAGLNTRTCQVAHDKCRITDNYKVPGQNIGSIGKWNAIPSNMDSISQTIQGWFSEYNRTNMCTIDEYPNDGSGFGHFTQIVTANATTVGCGATRWISEGAGYIVITCNYARTNIIGEPVYVGAEEGGSGCKTGTDDTYKSLCSSEEQLDPNYLFD